MPLKLRTGLAKSLVFPLGFFRVFETLAAEPPGRAVHSGGPVARSPRVADSLLRVSGRGPFAVLATGSIRPVLLVGVGGGVHASKVGRAPPRVNETFAERYARTPARNTSSHTRALARTLPTLLSTHHTHELARTSCTHAHIAPRAQLAVVAHGHASCISKRRARYRRTRDRLAQSKAGGG